MFEINKKIYNNISQYPAYLNSQEVRELFGNAMWRLRDTGVALHYPEFDIDVKLNHARKLQLVLKGNGHQTLFEADIDYCGRIVDKVSWVPLTPQNEQGFYKESSIEYLNWQFHAVVKFIDIVFYEYGITGIYFMAVGSMAKIYTKLIDIFNGRYCGYNTNFTYGKNGKKMNSHFFEIMKDQYLQSKIKHQINDIGCK